MSWWNEILSWFGSGTGKNKLPTIGKDFLVFWMPVNYWNQSEKKMLKYIAACADNGVGFGVEMAGWADSNIFASDARLNETIRLYKLAVKECRSRGIWMFASILNNNCHLSKYGNKGYTITSVWDRALKLVDAVKSLGKANQIIQPLAETQTGDGRKWEAECSKRLAGFNLVYNGGMGRPSGTAYGWPYFAWHPTKTSQKVPRGCMAVSDCGSIILQLHAGYDGKANAQTLKSWAQKCRAEGAILAADYAFKYGGDPDKEAIKALAEAAK